MALTIEYNWNSQKAEFVSPVDRPKYNIKKGETVPCFVLGLFQCTDVDDVNPYFVVKLRNGQCTYVNPEHLYFIEDEECERC